MKAVVVGLLLAVSAGLGFAAVDPYTFEREVDRVRYERFIDEMRCPKCQNQNLSGSDAPIAADLRRELHRLITDGKSDTEIISYMVNRYGDFVFYRPPFNARTALLWALPALLLLIGAAVVVLLVRRQRGAPAINELSAAERTRLRALLNDDESKTP